MALQIIGVLGPALLAGVVAIAVTLAVERWGGRVGGLLGTLPTTIVPAAAGIWLASPDPEAFLAAMSMTPVGMWVDVLFLWAWRVLPPALAPSSGEGEDATRAHLLRVLSATLLLWCGAAGVAVAAMGALRSSALPLWPIGLGALLLSIGLGVLACRSNPPSPGGRRSVPLRTLAARGLLAAVAIGAAVGLARVGGPLLAGMAAVFPAIFLTTMVSLWWSQGQAVQAGAVGPMMLGASSVSAYALLAAVLLPLLGVFAGSLAAWIAAVALVTVPAWRWLARQRGA